MFYIHVHVLTDRGELHKVAVVGPNANLIEEVPLFSAQEPVNNILLYKVITYSFYVIYCGLIFCLFVCFVI